jgi:hypothetical protein
MLNRPRSGTGVNLAVRTAGTSQKPAAQDHPVSLAEFVIELFSILSGKSSGPVPGQENYAKQTEPSLVGAPRWWIADPQRIAP